MDQNTRRAGAYLLLIVLVSSLTFCQTASSSDRKVSGVEILTMLPDDEMTVFTKKVLPTIISQTKKAWYPIIPREAQPPQLEPGKVGIEFELHSDGKVTNMELAVPSGKISLDRAAWGGITGAQPFAPFPPELKTEMIRLRFFFLYNIKPDEQASRPHQVTNGEHLIQ